LIAVMISDTLELRDDGTGTMRTTTVEPGTTKESRENIELTFMRSGNGIRMVMQCPIAAVCMRPPHFVGIVSEDGIVFTESVVSHAPLVFDRIQ
jgi:hypothetical protein